MMTQIHVSDLPIEAVDPDSPIPLYHQIERHLRELIQSRTLAPGDVLPPEVELSRAYGVGRHTMRMALARLAADNLIMRKAGRGTVVQQQTDRMKFYLDRSFTRQMADMGRAARSKVLEASTRRIDRGAPAMLRKKQGALCFCLTRLRFGDDEPIGLQYARVVTERCPGLERYDFNTESLYDVLARDYNLVISEITHTVSATVADAIQAKLLRVAEGDPLLVVNTAVYLEDDEIIEYTTSYYRADRYEYSTTDTYKPC